MVAIGGTEKGGLWRLGPVDTIGREGDAQTGILLALIHRKIKVGHLVAPGRVQLLRIDNHGTAIAIRVAAVAQQDNVGRALAIEAVQTSIRFCPVDAITRFGITDDTALGSFLGQMTGKGLIPKLIAPTRRVVIDAAPPIAISHGLSRPTISGFWAWHVKGCKRRCKPAVENVMVIDQEQRPWCSRTVGSYAVTA